MMALTEPCLHPPSHGPICLLRKPHALPFQTVGPLFYTHQSPSVKAPIPRVLQVGDKSRKLYSAHHQRLAAQPASHPLTPKQKSREGAFFSNVNQSANLRES